MSALKTEKTGADLPSTRHDFMHFTLKLKTCNFLIVFCGLGKKINRKRTRAWEDGFIATLKIRISFVTFVPAVHRVHNLGG